MYYNIYFLFLLVFIMIMYKRVYIDSMKCSPFQHYKRVRNLSQVGTLYLTILVVDCNSEQFFFTTVLLRILHEMGISRFQSFDYTGASPPFF